MKHNIYVGTYAPKGADSIFTGVFDDETGKIALLAASSAVENPSYLASKGGNLFAVGETSVFAQHEGGSFAVLRQREGLLELDDEVATLGEAPCHVLLDAVGAYAYVANYDGGSVSSFSFDNKENELQRLQVLRQVGSGPNRERQRSSHPHFCGWYDGHVYCADLGADKLMCYTVSDGYLVHSPERDIAMPTGSGVRHFTVGLRDKNILFVACELSSELLVVDMSELPGRIIERISTLPKPDASSFCAAIKQSVDGAYIFVSNRGHDSIAVFKVGETGREVALVDIVYSQGKMPRDFLVLPNYVLVAHQESNSICVFSFDAQSGQLHYTGEKVYCPRPVCIIEAI